MIKNTFKISNNDINKFILFFKKSVFACDYSDEWEKIRNNIEIKDLDEYHDFYLTSDK